MKGCGGGVLVRKNRNQTIPIYYYAAIAIANDGSGVTAGDCSALMSELGSYFDKAAAAVG